MSFASWCRNATLIGLAAFAGGGCGSEKVAQVGESCFVNTDCSASLVCVFQTCHVQCRADEDCRRAVDELSLCQRGARPVNVCQNEPERACTADATCLPEQTCATDARCRDRCQSALDCIAQQVCTHGACAGPSELVDGELPQVLVPVPGGAPCALNSDCLSGLVCNSGACRAECLTDRDCRVDQCCTAESRCALEAFRDMSCRPLADGGLGQGGEANEPFDAAAGGAP